MSIGTSNEDEVEVRSKEIADRLKLDWAELEARARENAKTIDGWNVEKQARYEEFLQAEKAEDARRRADREAAREVNMALAASPPKPERVPDPWESVLSTVESLPNVSGSLERANGYVKASSTFLLNKVLGIPRERITHFHRARLMRVMKTIGWERPPALWIGTGSVKGYRKLLDE
jgi:hypothetical protein